MIRFTCLQCGMKYELKEEFAGRQTRCRTCQQPLTVPAPAVPVAAPARIDGPRSSLHQLGISGGVTLSQSLSDPARPVAPPPTRDVLPGTVSVPRPVGPSGPRYQVAGELGRGGMGVVLRALDLDIRREVAVKYLLDADDQRKQARFVEEAQITGQLEHPNIAPVYDLDVDAQKRLFFTMKIVRGRSLAQVLDDLRKKGAAAEKEFNLGRLLTILVNVCHALSYAHARGVIHRDLKPSNIMLGDYGEVYVMDWGLAKLLRDNGGTAILSGGTASAPRGSAVQSNRADGQTELTQEGAVLGTPMYMPPEQASGRIHDVDQRSDVYALGAILYEMLTLQPPVPRASGYLAVLHQVIEGKIVPPPERTPERARQGRIPSELSAVALKALAKERGQRYPSADALRQDLERYLEGRSVSVKEDSKWETLVKFVKRNRSFSAVTSTALLVIALILGFSYQSNYSARVQAEEASQRAETALGDLKSAQEDKRRQARGSVPAFVEAARFSVERRKFDQALIQVNVALEYDPDHAAARLLRAQLLIVDQQYAAAAMELEGYLKRWPEAGPRRLQDLCHQAQKDDLPTLLAFSDAFVQQKAFALSDGVFRSYGASAPEARQKLLALFRQRLKDSWPGSEIRLALTKDGSFELRLNSYPPAEDLTPLRGLPLTFLSLHGWGKVRDLTPLQGMPLTDLSLFKCFEVRDLLPLKDMPLARLNLEGSGVSDLSPLSGMPLTTLRLSNTRVRDLSPLRGMKLTDLNLSNCEGVTDLSPLAGMPLASLNLAGDRGIRDLTPLAGMRLKVLELAQVAAAADLTFLKDMPLEQLGLSGTPIRNLSALSGLPLTRLSLHGAGQVADLSPLKGLKLQELNLSDCPQVHELTPLRGMPLESLNLHHCPQIRDLTALAGMPLRTVHLPPQVTTGMEVLRKIPTLERIHLKPAAEFWKEYDAKKPDK